MPPLTAAALNPFPSYPTALLLHAAGSIGRLVEVGYVYGYLIAGGKTSWVGSKQGAREGGCCFAVLTRAKCLAQLGEHLYGQSESDDVGHSFGLAVSDEKDGTRRVLRVYVHVSFVALRLVAC
eukprot:6203937-Pleurochrysis_carterae.AAC.2